MSRKVRERRKHWGEEHIDEMFESCSAYIISSGNPEAVDIDCILQYDGTCEHCPLFVPPSTRKVIKAQHLTYKKGVGFVATDKRKHA